MSGVPIGELIELAVAAAMIVGAVLLYRKRGKSGAPADSQGAVFLLLVGIIVALHALGAFNYRPSQSEIDAGGAMPMSTR